MPEFFGVWNPSTRFRVRYGLARNARTQSVMTEVSVVIPVLNDAETLQAQIKALFEQRNAPHFEIIVADNGSTDGSKELVLEWKGSDRPSVLIDASHRRGANVARNAGVKAARSDKVLFCDGDDVASADWVAEMASGLDEADGVAGVLEFELLNPHLRGRQPMSALAFERTSPVPIGACSGWRRTLILENGGFDESWRIGCDEIEFALRAAQRGAKVRAVDAVMHKREAAHAKGLFRKYFRYGTTRVRLIQSFPDAAARRSTAEALRDWSQLGRHVLSGKLDDNVRRRLAKNAGRLAGSAVHRHWAP